MSPAKSSVANAEQLSSQKKASSLAGFFSKILPSNRPEQGGTRRTDWTGDNDNAVRTSRSELTGWNLAKDKLSAHHTSTSGPEEPGHRRVWSWSPKKGDSRFVENLPRDRSRGRGQVPEVSDHEPQPPRKSEALTRTEVHELLHSKEETRKSRRSLKESGDWLGVQGADPYSGQFSILTPTDTLSSETTSTSTRAKLAGLARKKKAARLEYEQLRLLEEQEKDKARLDREQAKLNKIERVKEELRRQHQFARWSQHKRNWSSAAEPNLSPIAQSLDSVALGSSETSSLLFSELPTDSFLSDPEDITSATKDTEKHRMSPPTFDELQDRTVNNLPADAPVCQSQPSQPSQQGRTSLEKANRILHRTENHLKRARRESVSTPTTTITGCVPAQQSQPDAPQPKRRVEVSQVDGTTNIINSPATPASLHQHDPCMTPDLIPEERRTPSLPTAPQNSLLNPKRAQEIPGTGISSTRRVTPEKKQPTRVSTPTTPKLCRLPQKNGAMNQRDISEDGDAAERAETTKTEKAEHPETKKTIRQERAERVNRESRSAREHSRRGGTNCHVAFKGQRNSEKQVERPQNKPQPEPNSQSGKKTSLQRQTGGAEAVASKTAEEETPRRRRRRHRASFQV
ncbi:hypothetical protein GL218_04076 [Daldinia childiae]|uniref:uncharacterized protein n=1 Tax=Daldinia childiae TaxID=326645 RepID=UPI0014455C61|nr:uncharacterized protein GL218_04076 [Daldinia childiae]KAF3061602.1 hypothetical protein GL218_04076 [Daldinia childiae]